MWSKERLDHDLKMMKDPESWPYLFLPLKKFSTVPGKLPDFGDLYFDTDTQSYTFHPRYQDEGKPITPEELIADGWVVD